MSMVRRRKDYQRHQYISPVRQRDQRDSRRRRKLKLWLWVLVIGGVFVMASQLLRIRDVRIEGRIGVSESQQAAVRQIILEQQHRRRWLLFRQSSILTFSARAAEEQLLAKLPLQSVDVAVRLPVTVVVNLDQISVALVWVTEKGQILLSDRGEVLESNTGLAVVNEQATSTELFRSAYAGQETPIVTVADAQEVDPELVQRLLALHRELTEQLDLPVASYQLSAAGSDQLVVKTAEGWEAKFRLSDDLLTQASRLSILIDQATVDRSQLDYIDLRFAERVFYR